MAEFADEYRWLPEGGPVLAGTQRLVQWGGEGTPNVAEFYTLEVAAALRMTEEAVRLDIGLALAVRHRLPRIWDLVMAGVVRVWQARELGQLTGDLEYFQALDLDEEVAPLAGSMAWTRLRALVKARVLQMCGAQAQSEHEAARGRRRVDFGQSANTVTDMSGTLDAADALFLDAQLNRLAAILGQGGSHGSAQVRRAQALGVLASPARGLQLLQASLVDELPEIDPDCPAQGQRGHTCGQVTLDPDKLLPRAQLVVHLSDTTLRCGEGAARVEKVGPVLAGWVEELVGHARVSVRPVLDPAGLVPTDAYECPPRMREWVELRNPHEAFPFSKRASAGLDMDHTRPWRSGNPPDGDRTRGAPPLTRVDNLGPLSRKVHRAKTHDDWDVAQPMPGVYLWRSPLGFGYLVTPSQSWLIEDPSGRILPSRQPPTQDAAA